MSVKKPLKVGFDLDGVLLYNPARIARPLVSLLKKRKVIHRKELQFFVPQTKFQKLFWRLFHKSSLFISPAIKDIEKLVKAGEIEAYIITGRFGHLEKDTKAWFKKFDKKRIFKESFMNEQDEQPHLFKEKKIKELKLDYFVEDNWDIVNYLSHKKIKTEIIWITNLIDRKIDFDQKFLWLNDFIDQINKKKILFVTDYYLPHWTGLSKSINFIVKALEKNHDCSVLTIKHESNLPSKEIISQHLIHRVSFLFSVSRAKFAPAILFKYLKLLNDHEIIVINSPFTFVLPITLLAKLFNKKVYIFHQGDLILPNGLFNKLLESVFNVTTMFAFGMADNLATYTNDYAKNSRLLKFFPNKTKAFVIPFPMDHLTTKSLKEIDRLRGKYRTIIGLSGRFVEEKGFDVLFRAIPEIIKKNNQIHFVFAGEKNMGYEDFFEQHYQLYQQVKNNITFLGLLSGERLESFYKSIDALVMPSRSDCFGLVQAEAMKYSKPVIVTNIIGGRDAVSKTGFGEIVKQENAQDLASKILLFSKHKNKYKKFLPAVKKYFSFEKNLLKLEDWLS